MANSAQFISCTCATPMLVISLGTECSVRGNSHATPNTMPLHVACGKGKCRQNLLAKQSYNQLLKWRNTPHPMPPESCETDHSTPRCPAKPLIHLWSLNSPPLPIAGKHLLSSDTVPTHTYVDPSLSWNRSRASVLPPMLRELNVSQERSSSLTHCMICAWLWENICKGERRLHCNVWE